jgi:Ca-activated chloride channel family protein
VSDGEDLEGDIDEAVRLAKEAGVTVHTVGVGTEQGQPVPDLDPQGNRIGYKKQEDGSPVVSRLHAETLETIARGTGGRFVRVSPLDSSLGPIASAIEGMDQKGLVGEWSYRKKERFQIPLAAGLACLTAGLLLPPPVRRSGKRAVAAAAASVTLLLAADGRAETAKVWDEVTLRPKRLTDAGRKAYREGDHASALTAFEGAAGSRPNDPVARFNVADGLYKAGKYDEAATLFRSLGADPAAPLAAASRYNLGNTLFQKQDFPGAVQAYRDTLRVLPADADTRRNLELALREMKKQQDQQQKDQGQGQGEQQKQPSPTPRSEQEKEQERFQKEAGMPKERAMQLLSALQQNEKDEQKKLLARKPAAKKRTKDW